MNGQEKGCLLKNDLRPQKSTTYTLIGYNKSGQRIAKSVDLFVQVFKKSKFINSNYPIPIPVTDPFYNKLYLDSTKNHLYITSSVSLMGWDISDEPARIIVSPLKVLDSGACAVNTSKQCLYFSNNNEIKIIDIAQSPPEIKSSFQWRANSWADNPLCFSALDAANNRLYMSNGTNDVSIVDTTIQKVTSIQTEQLTAHQLIIDSDRHRLYIAISCNGVLNAFIYVIDTSKNPPSKVGCIGFPESIREITSMILNRHDNSLYALAGNSLIARVDPQQPSSRIQWISIQHQLTNLVLDEINKLLYCFASLIDSDIGIIAVVSVNLKKLLYTIDMKSKVIDVIINNDGDLYVACENGISLCGSEVIPELDISENIMSLEQVEEKKSTYKRLLKSSRPPGGADKHSASSPSSASDTPHTHSAISSSNSSSNMMSPETA